jgi:hypothetical protein
VEERWAKKGCRSATLDVTRATSCLRDAVLKMTHAGKEREKTPTK